MLIESNLLDNFKKRKITKTTETNDSALKTSIAISDIANIFPPNYIEQISQLIVK